MSDTVWNIRLNSTEIGNICGLLDCLEIQYKFGCIPERANKVREMRRVLDKRFDDALQRHDSVEEQ